MKEYSSGDVFGELALLYNALRAASVVAKNKCILWSLDRNTFNNVVRDASVKKRKKYETFLKSVEILSTLDPYELSLLSDHVSECFYREGDYVIKEVS